jgi:rifampicin phosphotransferase
VELTKMILNRREAASVPDRYLGGKAAQLAWLFRHGFPGPDFWVLTTQAWEAQLAYAGLTQWLPAQLAHLTADADAGAAVRISCAGIQERLLSAALCPKIEKQLCQTLNADSLTGAYVAVRSSVVGEDSLKASFAGQMDSFLFRKGVPQIVDALRRCWASAFSERAVRYRLQKGLPLHPVNMGVIMQLMIEGEVSGVVFTANPATGCRHQALLTSTYGLGEGLVSGECNADEYTIDYRSDAIIAKRISAKDYQREFDRTNGFGTRLVTIAGSAAQRPCLPDSWILEITRKARHIAGLAGCPQDIEWTLRGDTIYFLQTRPITILPSAAGASDRKTVWDNSNIQESYCGVTTPLTFSFASHAYATVYEQTMRLMGISEKVIAAHQDMLQNLLGLIRGRVYYNINQWYRGLLLLPSFQRNKADLERMMGLQDPVDFVEDQAYSFTGKLGKLPALLRTYARLLAAFRQLPARVTEFHRMFEAANQPTATARIFSRRTDQFSRKPGRTSAEALADAHHQ